MSAHHIVSGEIRIAHDISLEMMALFERLGDPHLQMIGEWSVGAALFHLGALEAGHQHLEQALTLYDPAFHGARVWQTGIEPGIFCRCELSRTTTLRGFPDTGLAMVQEAVADARALDHPQPLAFALLFEMFVHLARRTPREVSARRTSSSPSSVTRTGSRRSCTGPRRSSAARSSSSAI